MTLHVAVDFGTSSTCTAVSVDGGEPQTVVIDGQPLIPSAVFAGMDGTLFVGHEAERQAAVDPARFEPHPKRRVDEGELLLGSNVLRVGDVVRAVLVRVVAEARRYAGGAGVDLLVLTHPADWGATRTRVLSRAASGLARELALVAEPVAAAVFHSGSGVPEGSALAVLDLGGGTVDASAVRKQGNSFRVLAARGDPAFGGADIDQLLLEHVGTVVGDADPAGWRQLVEGREMSDRRRRRVLRQDVRGAKETLSRHSYTDVPMPPPFADAHVTRDLLESLIRSPLSGAANLVLGTLRDGAIPRERLAGVFLVGGSSRIPLAARLTYERTGVVPTTLDQPETIVARGALRTVVLDPGRTGALPNDVAEQRTTVNVPANAAAPTVRRRPVYGSAAGRAAEAIAQERFAAPGQPGRRRPRSRVRVPLLVACALVLVVGIGATLAYAVGSSGPSGKGAPPRTIAQYDYRFEYPADWERSGADEKNWKVQIKPVGAAPDTDLIAVQEGRLGYDASADPKRASEELRGEFKQAGPAFSGFQENATYAGKDLIHYRQHREVGTVDWYVAHKGFSRVSVGCQYTDPGRDRVRSACDTVVRTLAIN